MPCMESPFLMVGLGNPGAEYARTRHNAGFLVLEELARRLSAKFDFERKFNAGVAKADWNGRRVLLVQPQTFMNLSGEAVGPLLNFYRMPTCRSAKSGCGPKAAAAGITDWSRSRSTSAHAITRG
jgi:peptidyl-tRNA hydrolase, PTH1 family